MYLEVGLEQEIGRVVESPFPRLFERCSIQSTSAFGFGNEMRELILIPLLHTYH